VVKEDRLQCRRRIVKQKSSYAGHIEKIKWRKHFTDFGEQNSREEGKKTAKKNEDG